MSAGPRVLALAAAAALSACWYPAPSDRVPPPARLRATQLVSTTLKANAALGAGASFEVVTNGEGVLSAQFGPREIQRYVTAGSPKAVFRAEEFPEGIGAVILSIEGGWATMRIEDVQIDVTPPQLVKIHGTRLGAGDRLRLEVWDAVMVHYAEIAVGGLRQRVEINHRPMGTTIPVQFDTTQLPEGDLEVAIRIEDMAGNELLARIPSLRLDRTAPTLELVQPQSGSKVSGRFVVQVLSDDNLGPVTVELRASGSHLAFLGAPDASAIIDASAFPRGPLELEALATDEVGNQSKASRVIVEVE